MAGHKVADKSVQGQIITFYSYKGGTGRSMALANVACILAQREENTPGKGVLMIDWDLEAPGLHRYFCDRLAPRKRAADSLNTGSCDAEPGLIDLFYELDAKIDALKTRNSSSGKEMFAEDVARNVFDEIDFDDYIIPTNIKVLSLLKAGRFNRNDTNEYPERVNKFNWETLYNKSPQLMRVFAEVLAEKYDYVLIDSRTGVTDISGVCTMLLPEKLVVVFTPNMQSLMGAIDVVSRATGYRKESDDLRSLIVFPLVSRVESNEPELRYDWRFGNPDREVTGYQAEFEKVLAEAYRKEAVDLNAYFDEMQIQHIPRYAYGEQIAVLEERTEDKFSLRRSYKTFSNKLVERGLPWEELTAGEGAFSNQSASREPQLRITALIKSALTANTSVLGALLFLIVGVLLAGIIIIGVLYAFRSAPRPTPIIVNSSDPTPLSSPPAGVIGKNGYLTTNLRIRSQPSRSGAALGVHYQGALVEILELAISEEPEDSQTWYRVRVVENGCDADAELGCGNDLNGVRGKAAMEGWMNAKYVALESPEQSSGDQPRPSAETESVGTAATVNSPDDDFLAMRSLPDSTTGTRITKIPHGARVSIQNCLNYKILSSGKRGRWCKATYSEYSGWIFDAFVTY